jgi:hypothetical protein
MAKPASSLPEHPNCLNCGTELRGQYCGTCGQRARNRLISLWELLTEAFGDLFELDSRLWRTLIPLLVRPGRLTRDYLEGRRARYMPPFRMYLVLSVVFFVVAFFDPKDDLSLLFEPEAEPTAEEIARQEASAEIEAAKKAATEEKAREIVSDLEERGVVGKGAVVIDADVEADAPFRITNEDGSQGFGIDFDEDTGKCTIEGVESLDKLPPWLRKRATPERIIKVCERTAADGGTTLSRLLIDNIPVALIVLLPLMALVLKILYPLSRRYFVEHLLFIVHFHSFFFLILTLQILFARVTAWVDFLNPLSVLVLVAASLYIPVYLFLAMRRVYGQGRILTFAKFFTLVTAYGIGVSLTMMGALLVALISI